MSSSEELQGLLAGPRGRRLCWALVQQDGMPASRGIGPAWKQVDQAGLNSPSPSAGRADLARELAAAVDQADWRAVVAGLSELALVELLAWSVAAAMYWQPRDPVDRALAHPELAALLRPVADAVTSAPAARWWPSGVDLHTQQRIGPLGEDNNGPALSGAADRLAAWRAAEVEEERSAARRPADPAAPYSGHWWSAPTWTELVSTTRALPGLGPLQLATLEDWPGWTQVQCWPMTPASGARICEITGPGDWAALVARYPLDVTKSRRHDWWKVTGWEGTWLMPDYAAAARDYDAIHLTVTGYLTTAGRALTANDGRCLLAGWSPDETYWLADVITVGGPSSRWILERAAQRGWRPA